MRRPSAVPGIVFRGRGGHRVRCLLCVAHGTTVEVAFRGRAPEEKHRCTVRALLALACGLLNPMWRVEYY